MNIRIVLVVVFLFQFIFGNSQTQSVYCGYDMVINKIKKNKAWYQSVENVYRLAIEGRKDEASSSRIDVLTIPIVFHIVWNDSIENIPDSLIEEQIEVLNDAYRRTNDNKDNIRVEFEDIVGDPHIEFVLADVIRVHTDTLYEIDIFNADSFIDFVKETENGGSDPVDVDKYLNLWVCNIQPITIFGIEAGVILGYAYPPNDLDNWPDEFVIPDAKFSGVVIDYKAIGKNNPYQISVPGIGNIETEGRTAVHEIGHYLGLRHTAGDTNTFEGEDGCLLDDGLEDTPICATQSNFDCDINRNTCEESSGIDLPDMIENYMDYSSESCMNSFTFDQIDIMRYVLRHQRCELVDDCSHVGVDNFSVEPIVDIIPNPTSSSFRLSYSSFLDVQTVIIYNNTGILVDKFVGDLSVPQDVSNYPSGLYFVEINTVNNQKYIKKLVIK